MAQQQGSQLATLGSGHLLLVNCAIFNERVPSPGTSNRTIGTARVGLHPAVPLDLSHIKLQHFQELQSSFTLLDP